MDLQDNDVVSMDAAKNLGMGETSRIQEIRKKIRDKFPDYQQQWINGDGVECELLREGGRWQKGRVRLRLEFIPDNPESPLDDLRSNLNL